MEVLPVAELGLARRRLDVLGGAQDARRCHRDGRGARARAQRPSVRALLERHLAHELGHLVRAGPRGGDHPEQLGLHGARLAQLLLAPFLPRAPPLAPLPPLLALQPLRRVLLHASAARRRVAPQRAVPLLGLEELSEILRKSAPHPAAPLEVVQGARHALCGSGTRAVATAVMAAALAVAASVRASCRGAVTRPQVGAVAARRRVAAHHVLRDGIFGLAQQQPLRALLVKREDNVLHGTQVAHPGPREGGRARPVRRGEPAQVGLVRPRLDPLQLHLRRAPVRGAGPPRRPDPGGHPCSTGMGPSRTKRFAHAPLPPLPLLPLMPRTIAHTQGNNILAMIPNKQVTCEKCAT